MSSLQPKKVQRFLDALEEPLTWMEPISGYKNIPLVTLEQATSSLQSLIPEIVGMTYLARQIAKEKQGNSTLLLDQIAAIVLYTLEWEPSETSVYRVLNSSLRDRDRSALRPWRPFLKLFVTALAQLPPKAQSVFRGMRGQRLNDYVEGKTIVWWGFSSCTKKMQVLKQEQFMGSQGDRMFFTIECLTGRDISPFSAHPNEEELLLPAARQFQVISVVPQTGGLTMVQLKETVPPYPLLELLPNPTNQPNEVVTIQSKTVVTTQPNKVVTTQPNKVVTTQPNKVVTTQPVLTQQCKLLFHPDDRRISIAIYIN